MDKEERDAWAGGPEVRLNPLPCMMRLPGFKACGLAVLCCIANHNLQADLCVPPPFCRAAGTQGTTTGQTPSNQQHLWGQRRAGGAGATSPGGTAGALGWVGRMTAGAGERSGVLGVVGVEVTATAVTVVSAR